MATPVSLMEWFLNYWDEAMEGPVQPLQGTVGPGEVIFVPSGWWHMAINLEVCHTRVPCMLCRCQAPASSNHSFQNEARLLVLVTMCPHASQSHIHLQETVAITQNYCSLANLSKVLKFLEAGSAELVSGCAQPDRGSLHARFTQALLRQQPEVGIAQL